MTVGELEKIFKEYPKAAEDGSLLRGLLKDIFPGEKANINLLMFAYDVNVVEELQKNEIDAFLIGRLEKRLTDDYAVEAAKAKWAVDMWCRAYGVKVLGKQTEEDEPTDKQQQKKPAEKKESAGKVVAPSSCKVGDIVKFGSYWQGENESDGKTPIEWIVLDRKGDKVLLISKYALDCRQYNTEWTDVTWETCSLREWLNGTFIDNAFSSDEQNTIQTTTVTADKNPSYSTSPGNNTNDKVFLLSIPEVNKYFSSDEVRKCALTEYAKAQGAYTSSSYSVGGKATCWWWLRSPGILSNYAALVDFDGSVINFGGIVNYDLVAVRPALWISLETEEDETANKQQQKKPAEKKESAEKVVAPSSCKVGDIVKFGSYWQGKNESDGKTPIEWLVLDRKGDKALLISKYALDCQPYNISYTDVTWETCSLRKWLNGTFINNAFSSDEQNMIQTTTVTADKNPSYSTSPGNNTTDKVFLLSIPEVNKYFSTNEARKCAPTDYAKAQGAYTSSSCSVGGKATGWWWLRSPGIFSDIAAFVAFVGSVYDSGNFVGHGRGAVRPALWISLETEEDETANKQQQKKPAEKKESAEKVVAPSSCKVGDIVKFGSYWQGESKSNGKTPIEWLVLDRKGNKALLISKYALDCQPYNISYTDVTWETCSLRKWLNGTFINNAFSAKEQNTIQTTTVTADKNPSYSTSPGNNTTDKVFLLSIPEADKYFSSDKARRCAPTEYAKAQGAYTDSDYSAGGKDACWWWLRSPGYNSSLAADVDFDGSVFNPEGYYVDYARPGVRPAMWITLD